MKLHGIPAIILLTWLPAAVSGQGEAEARFQLARACLRGSGMPKDVNRAFELMKQAAEQGHADAVGALGYFYSVGAAVEKDEKQAAAWFRKGAEMGSAKARLNLGIYLIEENGDPEENYQRRRDEGIEWIVKAADQRLPEAALAAGRYYYFGDHGLTKDYGRSAGYFKIAADLQDAEAMNFIGIMSEYGMGVPLDIAVAGDWFRKAALQGHAKARANLGRLMNPLSEDKNQRLESLAWLILAAGQGEVTAEKSLAEARPGLADGELDQARTKAVELQRRSLSPKIGPAK